MMLSDDRQKLAQHASKFEYFVEQWKRATKTLDVATADLEYAETHVGEPRRLEYMGRYTPELIEEWRERHKIAVEQADKFHSAMLLEYGKIENLMNIERPEQTVDETATEPVRHIERHIERFIIRDDDGLGLDGILYKTANDASIELARILNRSRSRQSGYKVVRVHFVLDESKTQTVYTHL